jgi:hypothetical protein
MELLALERTTMNRLKGSASRVLWVLSLFLSMSMATASLCIGQEKHAPQTAGVDDTKMGAYRALGQIAYAAVQKGDAVTAAKLARVLERNWDKAEDYGGDTALSKTNHALFEQIDKAMDQFINLLEHPTATPDLNAIKTAYNTYLDKLKLAD